jgi:hypothetical protein
MVVTAAAPAENSDEPARTDWRIGDPLLPLEQEMIDKAAAGKFIDLLDQPAPDLPAMQAWGPERTIRAAVLRHLLVVEPDWPVHAKGVRLRGVRISGRLDLEAATLRCALRLATCFLDDSNPVQLNYATASLLEITHSHLDGVQGARLVVTKRLSLASSTFAHPVHLLGAGIDGQLSCRGAQLQGSDANGDALVADRLKVGGDVFLDEWFTAAGAIRLPSAEITGQLNCRGAQLQGSDANGDALVADRLKVGGSVVLDRGFTAAGAIRLSGAEITGQLNCRGAQLHGRDSNNALVANGLKSGGDVLLDRGFTAAGAVALPTAQIGGSCWLVDARLAQDIAVRAEGLKIAHELYWAPRAPVLGEVNLERAAAHRLVDNWALPDAHWPPQGKLRLTGFTYDGFGGNPPATCDQRLAWVRRSSSASTDRRKMTFAAQPYEQLIRVYRQSGLEADARRVAIAKRNDLRRSGQLTSAGRVGNWILDKTIRHGYQPLRAAALLAVVYLAVLLVLWAAQHRPGLVVPAKDIRAITPAPTAEVCVGGYPCFYPAGYAIDAVIPLLNLRQVENWRLNGSADWGWAFIAGTWVATGLGWAFSTLAVVGYTGLVRKD